MKAFDIMKVSLFTTLFFIVGFAFSSIPNASQMIQGLIIAGFWGLINFDLMFKIGSIYCGVIYFIVYLKIGKFNAFWAYASILYNIPEVFVLPIFAVYSFLLWYVVYPFIFIRIFRKIGFYERRDRILGRLTK